MKLSLLAVVATLLSGLAVMAIGAPGDSGAPAGLGDYKVLEPISHGDLTIFPVVSSKAHDTSQFITLDEGIRSGEVVVTEVGNLHSSMRRRPQHTQSPYASAEVNRLVLVNNSKHPLILLAGEVVTGGKQDRVVGKDRIVPAESDPVDLSVFCVEHGRWTESSANFGTKGSVMLQPSVRMKAMAEQDQQKVWDAVGESRSAMIAAVPAAPSAIHSGIGSGVGGSSGSGNGGGTGANSTAEIQAYASSVRELNSTTSYAKARDSMAVKQQVESIVQPMQKSYESVIKQLRNQNAVGVVVAVKGRIVWADMFASGALLDKYWPKLLDSYATEAMTASGEKREIGIKDAQAFLDNWQARHEVVDSEPGLYRQRELIGDRFKAFELTSLLAKAAFDIHLSKMAE
jgi:ARG/rhodanese/phosphatase superfamily protein